MPQRLTSISGFGLVRIIYDRGYIPGEILNEGSKVNDACSTEWQYRYLSLEGAGTLLWYTDESQLFPESFAAVTSEPQQTGESVPSLEKVLRMEANVGSDGRIVTLEIAVPSRELQIWQSILAYHLDEAEEYGTIGTTTTFSGNKASDHADDDEVNLLTDEHMDAVVSVTLKGQQHTLTLSMHGDAEALSQDFIKEQGLKSDYGATIATELLHAQLELYRSREGQLLKQFAKVQRKVHGIVVAEAHASMAEQLAAELTDAMTKVRTKIVPDLQNKVKTLEQRCAAYEQATNDAQEQQARSENSYIAENVRLKQELMHERSKRAQVLSSSARTTPNKSTAMSPISDMKSPGVNTTATSHASDIDSILGNIALGGPGSPGSYVSGKSAVDAPWGIDNTTAELQELRKGKVALLKQLRAVQDELNVTKYELSQAYGKKAEQRKFLNFNNDVLEEPKDMTNTELRIKVHKQKDRIDALHGVTHALEKERDSANARAEELAGKLEAAEGRYHNVSDEKNNIHDKLIEIQGEYDIKTVKKLEMENHHLKEEVVKFRGEVLRLKNKLDEVNRNFVSKGNYGGMINPSESMISNTPGSPRVLVLDPTSSPDKTNARYSAEGDSLTPRSALLSTYPMTAGNNEAKANEINGNGVNSSMSSLFGTTIDDQEAMPKSRPFSDSHAINPNGPVATALNSKLNDTTVKWNPMEQDALKQRLSPVVEDRLLRVIYHRYVHEHKGPSARDMMMANLPAANNGASSAAFAHAASAASNLTSNTTMTLGRFIRFAKEFHLCFVGSTNGTVTCTPPYLVSGEIDVIFHNAAKLKVDGDVSSREALRPYGFRAGGGTEKQYERTRTHSSQTTGLSLTSGQFVEAVKALACKLYANVIELQTGTLLECLPPRQKAAASRAVFDVLIKKKLLPIGDKLGLVPWPLIYCEQAVNVFGEFKVAQKCLSSHFPQLILWFDNYKTTYTPPSASAIALGAVVHKPVHYHLGATAEGKINNHVKTGITYKGMSRFAHDFGIVPYLMKEPQLYSMFQEFMLWSTLRPDELHKSLPLDVMRAVTTRDHGADEEEVGEYLHFGSNFEILPFGMSPHNTKAHTATVATTTPNKAGMQSPGRALTNKGTTRINSNITASGKSTIAPGKEPELPLPLSCGLPKASTANCRLGLMSYTIFFATVAQQVFPNYAPEHRILKLFDTCAQSGGDYANSNASLNSQGEKIAQSSLSHEHGLELY